MGPPWPLQSVCKNSPGACLSRLPSQLEPEREMVWMANHCTALALRAGRQPWLSVQSRDGLAAAVVAAVAAAVATGGDWRMREVAAAWPTRRR